MTSRRTGRKTRVIFPPADADTVLRVLRGEKEAGPVCASPLVTVTLDQMKKAKAFYPEAHSSADVMARLASVIHTDLGFSGIRVPFDLCVEAEAFGCRLKEGDGESPPSIAGPAFDEDEQLRVPSDVFRKGRFKAVFDALMILNRSFGRTAALFAGIVGPVTLVGHLYEIARMMCWPIEAPARLDARLSDAADFLSAYAARLTDAGGRVIVISDPSASGDLLSRKYFERYVLPAYQRMRERISAPVVLHICGDTNHFLDLLPDTGFECFSFEGPSVSVLSARHAIGDRMVLAGNIPTHDLLFGGTPDLVREECNRALRDGIGLLAPACGIPVRSHSENLRAMAQAAGEFLQRSRGRGSMRPY